MTCFPAGLWWTRAVVQITTAAVAFIDVGSNLKQAIESEKQTAIMQQELDAVDLVAVAAVAEAAKRKAIRADAAAQFLVKDGGLPHESVRAINSSLAAAMPPEAVATSGQAHKTTAGLLCRVFGVNRGE